MCVTCSLPPYLTIIKVHIPFWGVLGSKLKSPAAILFAARAHCGRHAFIMEATRPEQSHLL